MKKLHVMGGLILAGAVVTAISATSLFETNMAGNIQVKQAAISGDLSCRLEPGMYGQFFGDINTYKEAETFSFTPDKAQEDELDHDSIALPTRFNDGAKAAVSGSLRVMLPRDCESLIKIHRKFHSMDGVMMKLVLPAVRKALFSTGPFMSAGESYAARRGEYAALAEDQLRQGVIQTNQHEIETVDPITGQKKRITVLTKRTCNTKESNCVGGFIVMSQHFMNLELISRTL